MRLKLAPTKGSARQAVLAMLVAAALVPALAQTGRAGPRPPLPEGADWFARLEYHLPQGPGVDAVGAVGDRIERFPAAAPDGQELLLLRTEYAARFVQELDRLRAGARHLENWRDSETGISREFLQLPGGDIRVIETWTTAPGFYRMAVATSGSRAAALDLVDKVGELRTKGRFGGSAQLHSPSVTP